MARKMMDIGLDADEDLVIISGDFVAEESTYQHQRQLLLNEKGEFKQNPDICVGIESFTDDEGPFAIMQAIAEQFMNDGMEVKNLTPNPASVTNNKVTVFPQAFYK